MSLLISQGIAPTFDPSSGFPHEQPPTPPAHLIPRRCVALMIAAAVLAPPPQMGTAVRLNGAAQNNGLVRTANLPGPSNWSICTFFYLPQAPSGDASIWMLQDTNGSSPASYINLEVNGSLSLLIASNTQPGITLGTVAIKQWYFVCVSIGAGGAGNAYWGKVGAAALTTTALTSLSTGWTPASLTVGTDFFTEPIDARLCDFIVHTAALSSGEALAQSRKLRPQRVANLLEWWQLKSAATKLEESSGPQRVLSAIGAGSWLTEEGPLLLDGPLNPGIEGFAYEQPPDFARAKDGRPWLYPEGEVTQLSLVAPPTVTPGWYPDFPDFARGAPPLVRTGDFELVVQEREPVTDWLPDFPDFAARGALCPLNTGGQSWTNIEREPITDWLPDFPDFARAKTPIVNQGGLFWTNVEREPVVDWLPDFPDFARSSAPLVREGWEALWPLPITPVSVPAQFYPEYPDQVYARARPLNTGGQSWTNIEREPITDWLPDFPDFARALRSPLNVGGLSLWPLPITPVVVQTQFHPEYPDQTYARARPLNTGGLFWTNVEREPKTDWSPDFPDFPARGPRTPVNQGGLSLWPLPIPPAPAPALIGARYPDFTTRATLPVALLAPSSAFVQLQPAFALRAHWRCDDDDSAVIRDVFGRAPFQVIGSVPIAIGRVGNAREFRIPAAGLEAVNSGMNVGTDADLKNYVYDVMNNTFSISYWIRRHASATAPGHLLGAWEGSGAQGDWRSIVNAFSSPDFSPYFVWRASVGLSEVVIMDAVSMPIGEWMHVALIRQVIGGATLCKLYCNGVLRQTKSGAGVSSSPVATFHRVTLGAAKHGPAPFIWQLAADVDDIRLFSGVLSDADVLELFLKPLYFARGHSEVTGDDGRRDSSNDGRTRAALGDDARVDADTDTGKRRDET